MTQPNVRNQLKPLAHLDAAEDNIASIQKERCTQTVMLEDLLASLSSGVNSLIAAINLDYEYIYFNSAYADEIKRLLGTNIQLGMTVKDVYRAIPEQLAFSLKQWGRSLRGESYKEVVKFLSKGASENYYEVTISPIKKDQGDITGAVLVARNITQRLDSELSLTESEMRYQQLFDYIVDGLAICEFLFDEMGVPADYRILDVNPNFTRMVGSEREQIIGSTYSALSPSLNLLSLLNLDQLSQLAIAEKTLHLEGYSPALEGYYEVYAYSLPNNYFAIILSDVTEKKIEIDYKNWLASFPEQNPLPVLELDFEGKIAYLNPAARKFLPEIDHTNQSHPFLAGISEVINKFKTGERSILFTEQPLGNTWFHLGFIPFPKRERIRIYFTDITDRVNAEKKLHQVNQELEQTVNLRTKELKRLNEELNIDILQRIKSEEALKTERKRFNDVLEVLPAYVILLSPDGHISFANKYFRESFGESLDLCKRLPSNRDQFDGNCESFKPLLTGKPNLWEWIGPDHRIYSVHDHLFRDSDGSALILEMGLDITEVRKAQEQLRETSNYNRSLIEANLDILASINLDGIISDVNAATEAATGFTREEMIGTRFDIYFTDPEKANQGFQLVLEKGRVLNYELDLKHKDGHNTPVAYNASFYRDLEGNITGIFAGARDLTELLQKEKQLIELNRALEEAIQHEEDIHDQLVQAEKFAAMGRMLASITHEINNPLQTIKNCLYLITSSIPVDSPSSQFLSMATSETERISNLVAELREVYRPHQDSMLAPISLPELLENVHSLLKPQLGEKHVEWALVTTSEDVNDNWIVNGINDQLKQVIINLSMNAIDSMQPAGGQLQVSLTHGKNNDIGVFISDSGAGIDPQDLNRIFDPFFSTKTKGLGLGLSICYDIVQRHKGRIDVTSELGKGSAFKIWLPSLDVKQNQEQQYETAKQDSID